MHTLLVGPEFEENLSLRYLAAALQSAGHYRPSGRDPGQPCPAMGSRTCAGSASLVWRWRRHWWWTSKIDVLLCCGGGWPGS